MEFKDREVMIFDFLDKAKLPIEDLRNSLRILRSMRNRLGVLYQHTVNLFVLMRLSGEHLKIPGMELDEIANATITHDAGKMFVDPRLSDGHNFTEEWEYEEIKRHVHIGYGYLKKENALKAWCAVGHHCSKLNGYGWKAKDRKFQRDTDFQQSFVRTKLVSEDLLWLLPWLSIADFAERFLNSRTIFRGPIQKNETPEGILSRYYEGYDKYILAVLESLEAVRDN